MDSVGVARVAQNTHGTELILIFEKLLFGILFGLEYLKNMTYAAVIGT